MNKLEVRGWIEEIGIIAAIRVSSAEDALFGAEAVASSGIPVVEITLTVPPGDQGNFTASEEHARDRRRGWRRDAHGSRASMPRGGSPVLD